MKLYCMLVGVAGSAFSVEVENTATVDDLKGAIKAKKPDTVKCEVDTLRLYLAKRNDIWLKEGAVEGLDETDVCANFKLMKWATMSLNHRSFGFLSEEKRDDTDEEENAEEGGSIHVLVVVPTRTNNETSEKDLSRAQSIKMIEEIHGQIMRPKRKRYAHSEINSRKGKALLQEIRLFVETLNIISSDADNTNHVEEFNWGRVLDEDENEVIHTEEQQRDRYRKYIEDNIGDVLTRMNLCVFGVEKGKDILSAQIPGHDIELVGRTDLLILSSIVKIHAFELDTLPNVRMLIEVKREVHGPAVFQTISELIALDLLVRQTVVGLLTDLKSVWKFFWFAENRSIKTVTLTRPAHAFELIKKILAHSQNDDTLEDLPYIQEGMKRRKLTQILPSITEGNEADGIRESIEQYYDIASALGPDIDMARAVAKRVVSSIPCFELLLHEDDGEDEISLRNDDVLLDYMPYTPFIAPANTEKEWQMSSNPSTSTSSNSSADESNICTSSELMMNAADADDNSFLIDFLWPLSGDEMPLKHNGEMTCGEDVSCSAAGRATGTTHNRNARTPSIKEKNTVEKRKIDMTPQETYRLKNRERMRRVRRQQCEHIEAMRETLVRLEQHFQQLSHGSQKRHESHMVIVSSKNDKKYTVERLEAEYVSLADLSHHLQAEKYQLERMIAEKEIFRVRINQEVTELGSDLTRDALRNDCLLYSDFDFTPLTQAEADERIHQCFERLLQFEATSTPLSACSFSGSSTIDTNADATPLPPASTFGWTVSILVDPSTPPFVSCSKFFVGISSEDAMQRLWLRDTCPRVKYLSTRNVVRYETLQVINESTYVAGVVQVHPNKHGRLIRSTDLRFRMATEKGFVMGRCSVNPTSPELRKLAEEQGGFDYVDSMFWIEFTAQSDETTGAEGCLIKFYVHGGYNNTADRVYPFLLNVLSIAFLWENSILPSPWKLLPS